MNAHKCNCGCGHDKDTISEEHDAKHECGCKSGGNDARNLDAGLDILSDFDTENEEGHSACRCGGKC